MDHGRGHPLRSGNDQGMTLVETMVALVIVGVLISMALPAYENYKDFIRAKVKLTSIGNATEAVMEDNSVPLVHLVGGDFCSVCTACGVDPYDFYNGIKTKLDTPSCIAANKALGIKLGLGEALFSDPYLRFGFDANEEEKTFSGCVPDAVYAFSIRTKKTYVYLMRPRNCISAATGFFDLETVPQELLDAHKHTKPN